jgi:hypothetical protein
MTTRSKMICPDFERWWRNEASAITPRKSDDMESHAKRIAKIAWMNGAYKAKYPTTKDTPKCQPT